MNVFYLNKEQKESVEGWLDDFTFLKPKNYKDGYILGEDVINHPNIGERANILMECKIISVNISDFT